MKNVIENLKQHTRCWVIGNLAFGIFSGRRLEYRDAWSYEAWLGYKDEVNTTTEGEMFRYRLRFGLCWYWPDCLFNAPWQMSVSQHHHVALPPKGSGFRLRWIWDNRGPEMQRRHTEGWQDEVCLV